MASALPSNVTKNLKFFEYLVCNTRGSVSSVSSVLISSVQSLSRV